MKVFAELIQLRDPSWVYLPQKKDLARTIFHSKNMRNTKYSLVNRQESKAKIWIALAHNSPSMQ